MQEQDIVTIMKRHKDSAPEPARDRHEWDRPRNGRVPARGTEQAKGQLSAAAEREPTEEGQHIIQEAASYCLDHFPMLWTTGGLPAERRATDGSRQWIIRVYLRYPTGFEGYLGDLLYDGKQFTELTERAIMRERAKSIAADPEGIRQWNEYRASTLRTRKA